MAHVACVYYFHMFKELFIVSKRKVQERIQKVLYNPYRKFST